jgi:hypothetical protein
MNGKITICGLLVLVAMVANGQKLWEKVYNHKDYNYSNLTDSDIIGDSLIVISGFRNTLTCHSGVLNLINIKGEEIKGYREYELDYNCGYNNCHGTFRYLKATDSFFYSCGEANMDDIHFGDEPVFLRKFYPSGELVFSVAWHNTDDWPDYFLFTTSGLDAHDDWGALVLGGDVHGDVNHIIRFDNDGAVIWEKIFEFQIHQVLFLENEEFAIRTNNNVFIASPLGEIMNTLELDHPVRGMVYLDQRLYLVSSGEVFSWDINSLEKESIQFNIDETQFSLLNVFNDSLWVLSNDSERAYLTNAFSHELGTYNFSMPSLDVNNFFITEEEIILAGTTIQGQMALVAFSRERFEPDVDWADLELVDFEISNTAVYYEDCPDFGPLFEGITFDTQITLRNNGKDTIHSFGLQSDRVGGFNCGRHYFYYYYDELTIEPGQTKVINIGNSADFPYHIDHIKPYKLCYQVVAPNARLENNTENNLLCKTFDFNSVPEPAAHLGWMVYPNPANHHISLEAPIKGPFHYQIFSIEGRLIHSGEYVDRNLTLDISHLPIGIYILRLQQGEGMELRKIVRQ